MVSFPIKCVLKKSECISNWSIMLRSVFLNVFYYLYSSSFLTTTNAISWSSQTFVNNPVKFLFCLSCYIVCTSRARFSETHKASRLYGNNQRGFPKGIYIVHKGLVNIFTNLMMLQQQQKKKLIFALFIISKRKHWCYLQA